MTGTPGFLPPDLDSHLVIDIAIITDDDII